MQFLRVSSYRFIYIILVLATIIGCKNETSTLDEYQNNTLFKTLDQSHTGIDFINNLESNVDLNILNYLYFYNGGGVAVADFNNDGLPDLYFTANQNADRLYINQDSLRFKDVTQISNIDNKENFTTGVTTVDINNDGFMDIYISKVGNHNGIRGHNLLYVNQGPNEEGIPIFKEESANYNLNISSYATQSVFFDYDLDNDLDVFLLNHSVFPNSNYGRGSNRTQIDSLSGDRLYENENGYFKDVSDSAGIFQGKIGYGLGVSIGDVNNDGYPDIYVGNDFFENDYLYINNQDKTFKEVISSSNNPLGHTSHFSMGNALNDVDNDGHIDILSLDMLPEDLKTYKTSGLEYSFPIYSNYLRNGYAPQYMQNTFHKNNGDGSFSEISFASGIAATEWSWSPLIADYNNDGFKDLYITNGILGATNDMDFINFISNDHIQKRLGNKMTEKELELINKIPKKKLNNYAFKNNGDNTFSKANNIWLPQQKTYSNGAIFSDLDLDGDLDLVINNVNDPATVLENSTDSADPKNYIKIKFNGPEKNRFGIGAKVLVYFNNTIIKEENYTTRGFLSAVEPSLHIGLGQHDLIDSLTVVWSDRMYETITSIKSNQSITLNYDKAEGNFYTEQAIKPSGYLSNVNIDMPFKHTDNTTIEFNRDPLIPYASTNEGPDISVADFNGDGMDDIFISGAKGQASSLFYQTKANSFLEQQEELFADHSLNEDITHDVGDINNDGYPDLIVASGGNEFRTGKAISPRIYYNRNGKFEVDVLAFETLYTNASKIKLYDFNNDGYLDVLISSDADAEKFGKTPLQYIMINDGRGKFEDKTEDIAPKFKSIGNVKDVEITDMNADGLDDIVVVGHWMPISIFYQDDNTYVLEKTTSLEDSNGWWNSVALVDFDKDGDNDIIAGNWGLNSRLSASKEYPITLYSYDFDNNGSVEPLLTYYYNGIETTFASKEELAKQLPFVNKEFLSFKDFSEASLEDIFSKSSLDKADKKYNYLLASCYFENIGDGNFKRKKLPFSAQLSSVNDILIEDFNNDGYFDVLLTGNNYEISTQLSRLDASHGELLLNNKNGGFLQSPTKNFDISGAGRVLKKITLNNSQFIIVGRNNDSPLFLKIN